MFFFKNNVLASSDKIFYDFKINDIGGRELNLNEYRNKVIYKIPKIISILFF